MANWNNAVPTYEELAEQERQARLPKPTPSIGQRIHGLARKFDYDEVSRGMDAFGPAGSGVGMALRGVAQLPRVAGAAMGLASKLPSIPRMPGVGLARMVPGSTDYNREFSRIMSQRHVREGLGGYIAGKPRAQANLARALSPQQGAPIDPMEVERARNALSAFSRPAISKRAAQQIAARQGPINPDRIIEEAGLVDSVKKVFSPLGARVAERAQRFFRDDDDEQ